MMRDSSLEAKGKLRDSKASRAEERALPAFCSLCLVDSAFHHKSPPPTTRTTATHMENCLCALIHAITRARASLSCTAGRAVPTDVAIPLDPLVCRALVFGPPTPLGAVPLGGLEHPANGLGNRCSIPLGYRAR